MGNRYWSKKEEKIIKEYWPDIDKCLELLDRSRGSIWKKSLSLNLRELHFKQPSRVVQVHQKYWFKLPIAYFNKIKSNARGRNRVFRLTPDDILDKLYQQNGKCIYTGLNVSFYYEDGYKKSEVTASVDRINGDIGYTKKNIQIVHKDVNMMRGQLTEEKFIELCKKVAENN